MKRTILLALLLPSVLAATVTCAPTAPKYELKLPDLHAKLSNGMRVIVLPDPTTDLVEVDVRYEVGSNEDPEGKAGLAHLVEHLMFQQRPAGPDRPPIGAVMRQLSLFYNAYTNWDSTHYMTMSSAEHVEELVSLEAARLYTGCETITEDVFQKEREVVRNEIRTRLGAPEAQMLYTLLEDVFPEGHPYRRMVGGDDLQLASITLADACRFMSDYYVPERATVIIAGNITEERAKEITAKWLDPLPAKKAASRRPIPPLSLKKKKVEHEMDVEETTIFVAWALPPEYSADGQAASFVIGRVAGRTAGFGEDWDFATNVGAQVLGGPHAPVFVLEVSLRDAGKVDEALGFIHKAAATAHWGLQGIETPNTSTRELFEKLRARIKGSLAMQFESLPARTNMFGDYAQFDPEGKYFRGELERIDSITEDRVHGVVRRTLDDDKAVVVVVKAKKGGAGKYRRASLTYSGAGPTSTTEEFEVDPEEAKTAIDVPVRSTQLSSARRFQLDNGMDVVFVQSGSGLPVVTVNLVFGVGSAHESSSKAGIASIAAENLLPPGFNTMASTEETGGRQGYVVAANALGEVGAQQGRRVSADATVFTVRALNLYLGVILQGLERLIVAGDYAQDSLESYRRSFGFAMKRRSVKSRYELLKLGQELIYGKDHPYGRTGLVSTESLENIGRDAAYDFKSKHYSAKNATLIVAGNFDEKQAEKAIRDHFGDWSGGHEDQRVDAPLAAREDVGPVAVGVAGEEGPTLEARIVYPGPKGIDDAYAARLILAEMMNKRMNDIRERLGASYGVYARYSPRVGPGTYEIAGPIDAERGGEVLKAMRSGLDSLRSGEGFDADFVRARRMVLQELLSESGDSTSLAQQLTTIAVYGLKPDYYDALVKRVAAVSPTMVKALIAKELDPRNEILMVLGDEAHLQKAFDEAGLTHAEIRE